MTEPRMRLRQKGQQFPTQDSNMPIPPLPRVPPNRALHQTTLDTRSVEAFLLAFGDNDYPLPETVRILDEIVTDYIIETCHEAASVAHHARRAKIKLDDFKFMLRRDTGKLGRVSEMLETDKELKRKRKAFDTDEGAVMAEKGTGGADGDGAQKEHGEDRPKMGRPKKVVDPDADGEPKKKRKKKEKSARMDGGGDDASTRNKHDSMDPDSPQTPALLSAASDGGLTAAIDEALGL